MSKELKEIEGQIKELQAKFAEIIAANNIVWAEETFKKLKGKPYIRINRPTGEILFMEIVSSKTAMQESSVSVSPVRAYSIKGEKDSQLTAMKANQVPDDIVKGRDLVHQLFVTEVISGKNSQESKGWALSPDDKITAIDEDSFMSISLFATIVIEQWEDLKL